MDARRRSGRRSNGWSTHLSTLSRLGSAKKWRCNAKHGLALCFSALCTVFVYIYYYCIYIYIYIYIRCTSQQTWLDPDRARLNTQRGFHQIFSPTFRVTQVLNWPSSAPQILSWCKKKSNFTRA